MWVNREAIGRLAREARAIERRAAPCALTSQDRQGPILLGLGVLHFKLLHPRLRNTSKAATACAGGFSTLLHRLDRARASRDQRRCRSQLPLSSSKRTAMADQPQQKKRRVTKACDQCRVSTITLSSCPSLFYPPPPAPPAAARDDPRPTRPAPRLTTSLSLGVQKRRVKCETDPNQPDAPCIVCTAAGTQDSCTFSRETRKRGPQAGYAKSLAERANTLERLLVSTSLTSG